MADKTTSSPVTMATSGASAPASAGTPEKAAAEAPFQLRSGCSYEKAMEIIMPRVTPIVKSREFNDAVKAMQYVGKSKRSK